MSDADYYRSPNMAAIADRINTVGKTDWMARKALEMIDAPRASGRSNIVFAGGQRTYERVLELLAERFGS